MPMPENGQSFVNPQSAGSGGWMAKLFGGVGDIARARSMAQIQFDLHQAKAGVDTEHHGIRTKTKVAAETAGKDYLGERGFSREKRRATFFEKKGVSLAETAASNTNGIAFQKKGLENRATPDKTPVDAGATDGGKPTTPPTGGGAKPKKSKNATIKDTESAIALSKSGTRLPKKAQLSSTYEVGGKKVTEAPGTAPRLGIDVESGTDLSPNFAKKLGRKAATDEVKSDGGVTPPKVTKPRKPKGNA